MRLYGNAEFGRQGGVACPICDCSIRACGHSGPHALEGAISLDSTESLNANQVAKLCGVTRARVSELCLNARIEGARKVGSQWVIPVPPVLIISRMPLRRINLTVHTP